MLDQIGEVDPPRRLLMGPGPVEAHPRASRAVSADLLGHDPETAARADAVAALDRPIRGTGDRWTALVTGAARAGIAAAPAARNGSRP